MPDPPDLENLSIRELEDKLAEIDADIKSIRRDTHAAGPGAFAELLAQSPTEGGYEAADQTRDLQAERKAVEEVLARKRADAEGLPDPWKHTESPPDPDAPDFGWTTKKKVAAGAVAAAVVAAIVAAIAVLTGGGSDKKSAATSGTTAAATTAPATSPASAPTDTTAVAAASKAVHFLVDDRKHDLVTDIALCGGGPASKGTGNWHFVIKGDRAAYEGEVATLHGIGPGIAGTYHAVVHGGRVSISKPLPCAAPGTKFGIGLVSVGGAKAVQDGALG